MATYLIMKVVIHLKSEKKIINTLQILANSNKINNIVLFVYQKFQHVSELINVECSSSCHYVSVGELVCIRHFYAQEQDINVRLDSEYHHYQQ